MSSKWVIVIVVILFAVALLALLTRKTVHAELTIQGTPEDIWSVLVDSSSYPNWNPIFVSVDGDFSEGETLAVELKSPDDSIMELKFRVKNMVENITLNQVGGIPGVLAFNHTWSLEAIDGGTRLIQHEEFRGIGVLIWDPAWVEAAYKRANENLKARIERNQM